MKAGNNKPIKEIKYVMCLSKRQARFMSATSKRTKPELNIPSENSRHSRSDVSASRMGGE